MPDADRLPYYERGAPLRALLHWMLSAPQRQLVHAAAVGTQRHGVLLAGRGGSGKSTTALACLDSPLFYVGDDYCLLETSPAPRVHSVYNTAKLDADNVHRFPHRRSAISNIDRLDSEKALLFLQDHCPDKVVRRLPIHAVCLPRVSGRRETTVVPASAVEGLKALAPSTLFQLPGARRSAFETISALVRQVPCYRLELGTNLADITRAILSLLPNE